MDLLEQCRSCGHGVVPESLNGGPSFRGGEAVPLDLPGNGTSWVCHRRVNNQPKSVFIFDKK